MRLLHSPGLCPTDQDTGTDKVVTADADRWEILEVEVRPYGTLDTETKYLMQLKPGALTYIGVAEDGMLLSINAKPRPEAPEPNLRPAPRTEQTPFSGKEYLKYVNERSASCLHRHRMERDHHQKIHIYTRG